MGSIFISHSSIDHSIAAELKREAIRLGMVTLRQSALHKLAEGITTMSEVFRVSAADF